MLSETNPAPQVNAEEGGPVCEDGIYLTNTTSAINYLLLGVDYVLNCTGQAVEVCFPYTDEQFILIPLHQACLQIAKRVMKVSTAPCVASMKDLWNVLEHSLNELRGQFWQHHPLKYHLPRFYGDHETEREVAYPAVRCPGPYSFQHSLTLSGLQIQSMLHPRHDGFHFVASQTFGEEL